MRAEWRKGIDEQLAALDAAILSILSEISEPWEMVFPVLARHLQSITRIKNKD